MATDDSDQSLSEQDISLLVSSCEAMERAVEEQDQRIARFLTAIAFFVAAGVSAIGLLSLKSYVFLLAGDKQLALPLIFLTLFLITSFISALLLVVASSPPERWNTPYTSRPSYLSWPEINHAGSCALEKQINLRKSDLPPYIRRVLLDRIIALAAKAAYKNGQTLKARATFIFSLVFISGGFCLYATAIGQRSARITSFGWLQATTVAIVTSLITVIAISDRSYHEDNDSIASAKGTFGLLAIWMGIYSFGAVMCSMNISAVPWPAAFCSIAAIGSVCSSIEVRRWKRKRSSGDPKSQERRVLDFLNPWIMLAPAILVIVSFSWRSSRPWTFLLSLVPLLIFEGIRLVEGIPLDPRVLAPGGGLKQPLDVVRSVFGSSPERVEGEQASKKAEDEPH